MASETGRGALDPKLNERTFEHWIAQSDGMGEFVAKGLLYDAARAFSGYDSQVAVQNDLQGAWAAWDHGDLLTAALLLNRARGDATMAAAPFVAAFGEFGTAENQAARVVEGDFAPGQLHYRPANLSGAVKEPGNGPFVADTISPNGGGDSYTGAIEQGRDAQGKFTPKSEGQISPGSAAVDDFVQSALNNGWSLVDKEVSFGTPFGLRRYDAVLSDSSSLNWGFEIKSSEGAFSRSDSQQFSGDRWINMNGGANAVGKQSGVTINGAAKVLWQGP